MKPRDAQTLVDYHNRTKPIPEDCFFCGTTRSALRALHNYRGCMSCNPRNGQIGKAIGAEDLAEDQQRAINRAWLESKEKHFPGGFSAFCKKFNLNENELREDCR